MCPATVQADTQITTYSYIVTGKPQPTVDLAEMLAAAGLGVYRPLAPPEFWRAIFEVRPKEISTHFDPGEKCYRSTGLRDVMVRREAFELVWGSTDMDRYHEDDSSLLCSIQAMRKAGRTTIEFPPELSGLAGVVGDAFLPHVPECTITIADSSITMTPLPIVGKVRIPKAKLEGIVYDLASDNPRLARIQAATLHAPLDLLLAEARLGSAHPKSDGDEDKGDKIEIRCPSLAHRDDTPSSYVTLATRGFVVSCSSCSRKLGSSLPSLIRAYNPRMTWAQACARAEDILGLPRWAVMSSGELVVGDELRALAALVLVAEASAADASATEVQVADAPQSTPTTTTAPEGQPEAKPAEPVDHPPAAQPSESGTPPAAPCAAAQDAAQATQASAPVPTPSPVPIAAWLQKQARIGETEVVWMASRKIDSATVNLRVPLWSASLSGAKWDGLEFDELFLDEWGSLCYKHHTLLLPTVDHTGTVVGVRARLTTGEHRAKCLTPSLWFGDAQRGFPQRGVVANAKAIRALKDEILWPSLVIVTEGEPDFLTACQLYPDAAVLGMYKARESWTQEIADRIPTGSKVYVLTDPDGPGAGYRRRVIRSLKGRCRVWRLDGRRDLNALHMRGDDLEEHIVETHSGPLGLHGADNAVRLVEHLDGAARHAAGRGWLVCRDGVWCPDKEDKEVRRYAEEALRKIPEEAHLVSDEKVQAAIYKHARVSLGRQGIREAIYLAESNREVCVEEEQLDVDPFLLGTTNGVLDLREGVLLDEPASALVTKRVPVEWDPAATAPLWERFLSEVFDGDQELIEFLRRWIGYCLTGETREHKLLVLHGQKSRNGKSTVLETMLALLGSDYGHGAKPKVISAERGHGEHDTDRNAMRGRRLTVIDEWPRGVGFSEDMIKRATGAKAQSGRGIGEDETNFVATTKITIGSNPLIEIIGEDDAVWNRVRYLPFEVSFLGREDKTLGAKLAKELPGILAWAVRGCLEWQRRGLDEPDRVKAHTAAAREDADDLARWAASALDFGAAYSASPTELAASWAVWAESQKLPPKLARRITVRTARSAVEVRWSLTSTRGAAGAKVLGVRVRPGSQFALPDQDPGLAESLACLGN